ncbi:MAG: [Fe-Fe] hydrogenase large subunit C-terminal domain-containing protein [Eubacteriales bacterium]
MAEYIQLKKSNCKNCYKCIRHCPVKSIHFSDNQASIISDECILCGNCFVTCPQNAKIIRNDVWAAKELIKNGAPVYASIAPSFIANYNNADIASIERALIYLGFAGAEETAIGAEIVTKQYDAMIKEASQEIIITSCCHTINLLIQKYYPAAIKFLAHTVSPMQAHCSDIKRRFPDAKTVFIGPCISKKDEGESYPGIVDCVLTFEELSEWFGETGLSVEHSKHQEANTVKGKTRLYPTAGGILRSMSTQSKEYTFMTVDGIDNCVHAIEDILNNNLSKCFIEMSACTGSCIGGPVMDKKRRVPVRDYIAVSHYAGEERFTSERLSDYVLNKDFNNLIVPHIIFNDREIKQILKEMGKTAPEHELNCGTCGYNTCREKAVAVLKGKAVPTMCLPYLKEKAESFSEYIIMNTPNAVIVLNEEMAVQQINTAACQLLNIRNSIDVTGEPVVRILDPQPFLEAYSKAKNTYEKRIYLAEYQKYVDQTVIYDKNYHIIICIMRDVTEEEKQRETKESIIHKTIEITDKVIAKQMRSVQEIASLLGETTAETKVALEKLKESLKNE